MADLFNPATPAGFATIAIITALVVLVVLPAIDKVLGETASTPIG
jgi:hypothetical protein